MIGSSRSGKSWSAIDFIVYLAGRKEKKATVNIIRSTYNSFKTTLYEDFNRRLPDFGIVSPFEAVQEKPSFYIGGVKINLIGADKPQMGAGSDYVFFNEFIHIPQEVFDQYEMRCRKFWFADSNPEFTKHWIYDSVIPRDDVGFLKTTFLDNPYISELERNKILSYKDTPENRRQGTVDEYNWKVFGLGERSARKGAVYNHWKIADYPDRLDYEIIGIDFGFNNPTAVVLVGYKDRVMYTKQLIYESDLTNSDLIERLKAMNLQRYQMYCDSAEPARIIEISRAGFHAVNSIKDVKKGIDSIKSRVWFIDTKSSNIINEAQSYSWKEKAGDLDDLVVKKDDHSLDAIRMANYTHHNRPVGQRTKAQIARPNRGVWKR